MVLAKTSKKFMFTYSLSLKLMGLNPLQKLTITPCWFSHWNGAPSIGCLSFNQTICVRFINGSCNKYAYEWMELNTCAAPSAYSSCTIHHEPKFVSFLCEHKRIGFSMFTNCTLVARVFRIFFFFFSIWTGQRLLSACWNYGLSFVHLTFVENWFTRRLVQTVCELRSAIKACTCVQGSKPICDKSVIHMWPLYDISVAHSVRYMWTIEMKQWFICNSFCDSCETHLTPSVT